MFEEKQWHKYLAEGQWDLVREAYQLLERERREKNGFHDYSFVVFPMAKAYEGFLKKWFLELGLIDQRTYEGDRFRIGKGLNPDLPHRHRGRWWLYGSLVEMCGEETPRKLWRVWRECRNRLFHFFPQHKQMITVDEAGKKVGDLAEAMKAALECKLPSKNNTNLTPVVAPPVGGSHGARQ